MSNPRVNSFFSVFEKPVQDEIMDFCRRITATHADIYIFMARKAAAFCDCLEELGLIHLDGYVTTDRSLDINEEWLAGKDVVIVDDAVVSGTTLYKTIRKLEKVNVKSISIQILTVNEKWFNPELLENNEGESYVYPVYNKLSDNLCIKLCNDIVQAISLVPRPYDVDFPLFKSINISESELNRILVLNNWETYDVRTELQKEHNIINFTLIPNECELQKISELFNIDITHNCIVKLRIYGRLYNKAKKSFSIRISPLVIFDEMDVTVLKSLFSVMINKENVFYTFNDWNSFSQLRLLQFYYSNILAKFWLYRIDHLLESSIKLTFSYRNLSFIFPENYINTIELLCGQFIRMPGDVVPLKCSRVRTDLPETIYKTKDPVAINARLYEPFINMYHDKELPCREIVLKKGKKVFQDTKYKKLRNRLDEGVSFKDLVSRLSDCNDYYDVQKKVSIFIDYSIDAGIIVPITQQDNNTIFRAYRHGEDVLFGRREEMLYIKMLSLFLENSGSKDGISRLNAEKLIVLFSKIGLKEKILHPYTSNFSSEPLDSHGEPMKILRVKPYLKGPVAVLGSALQHQKNKNIPYITSERKGLWLTNILIQNGCLLPNEKNQKYLVNDSKVKSDLSLLTDAELTFVQNFAELTGRISNKKDNTGISFCDNDWAKVSVTLTLPDTITAVAAEMELFYNDFDISKQINLTHNKKRDVDAVKHFINSFAFESVHNAIMKIESFTNKKGQNLINSICFPSSVEQRVWLSYFSDELNNNSEESNEHLNVIFFEQKIWSYLMEAFVNAIYILLVKRCETFYKCKVSQAGKITKAYKRFSEALENIIKLKECMPGNAGDAQKMLNKYDELFSLDLLNNYSEEEITNWLVKLTNNIEETEIIASNIKETVCDVLGERGKINEVIRYNYAFHINLENCPEDKQSEAYSFIESAYKKELSKIEKVRQYSISKGKPIPQMKISELPHKNKPLPNAESSSPGIWYIAHGHNAEDQIASFAMNVFYKLYTNNIDCQVSLFDSMRYDCCIKSNSSEYADYHCNQFNTFIESFKDIIFPLKYTGARFVHICPKHLEEGSKIRAKLQQTPFYTLRNTNEKQETSITKTNYNIVEYSCTGERRLTMNLSKPFDFGIITILPEELDAIKKVFKLEKQPSKFGERIFYITTIKSVNTDSPKRIVCTQAVDQGEMSVINAYNDLVNRFQPKIVFLIGIAGGISKTPSSVCTDTDRLELDLCDVVIAKSVIDYEMRKETENGLEHRARTFEIKASLAVVINDFLSNLQDNELASTDGGKNPSINVLFEPIGSGNAVIAHNLSSIRTWLTKVNSKVAAVEMEATGISSSFYESALNGNGVQGLIIVRGISDLADVDKTICQKYRLPAAKNAALVSKNIIEVFPEFK